MIKRLTTADVNITPDVTKQEASTVHSSIES
jgi:hypothetical protein